MTLNVRPAFIRLRSSRWLSGVSKPCLSLRNSLMP